MARRKQHGVSFAPLVIVAALLIVGWLAWKYAPQWLPAMKRDVQTATRDLPLPGRDATTPAEPAKGTPAAHDVCGLAAKASVQRALGAAEPSARAVGAPADVPAAGACTWSAGPARIVAMMFTAESLAGGVGRVDAHAWYETVVTGFEYSLKSIPDPIRGLGDEAAAAGFESGEGQIVVRKGSGVLQLVTTGVPRARAEAFARELANQL